MILDEFLDKLENVRSQGGAYTARCPAHDDRENSLGVKESDDRLLVKCYAGCDTERVVSALGLGLKDLFLYSSRNFAEPEAVYDYADEAGGTLFQTVRLPGKRFRQRHYDPDSEYADKDGWVWNLENVRRVVYRLPEVREGIRAGMRIYIVEGEKDVESLRSIGKVATCNPMGAGKWRDEYSAQLEGAHVVIIADRDEPGRKHAEKVKESLEGKAQSIWMYQAKVGKDVSEHLEAGLGPEQLMPMRPPVRRGIITARELAQQGLEDLDMRESDMPSFQPWGSIPLQLRQGRAYAFGAYTGDGKTSLALQGFRTLAEAGHRVGYFSLEMPERDLRNKLLAHAGIPLSLSENPWLIKSDPEMKARYELALASMEGWLADVIFNSSISAEKIQEIATDREYEVVFVDHLHRFAWGSERRRLDEQVNALTNMALELNITMVVLCQLRKFTRGKDMEVYPRPLLQDFRETSMIGDDAAMALAIWRERPDGINYSGVTQVIILKNRHTSGYHDRAGMFWTPYYDEQRQLFLSEPILNANVNGQQAEDPWIPTS